MLVARSGRLFHAIVVVGVSLTGGTLVSCGDTTSTAEERDASGSGIGNVADSGAADGSIADSSVADGSLDDHSVAESGVADSSVADDFYVSIMGYFPDAYVRPPMDAALNPDSQADGAPADAAPVDAAAFDACYACIHPVEPDACAYGCIAPP